MSIQSEIDDPVSFGPLSEIDSLKQYIIELEAENNIIKAKNCEFYSQNAELKTRVAKLEDMQTQNVLIKNLLSVSRKTEISTGSPLPK
jgi:cell shape-determining protein MreC